MAKLDFGGFVLFTPDGEKHDLLGFNLPGPEMEDPRQFGGNAIEAILGKMIFPDIFGELDLFGGKEIERIPAADKFFANLKRRGKLVLNERRSLMRTDSLGRYNRVTHEVEVCPIDSFRSAEEFYRVCAHECGHWTAPFVDRTAGDAILDDISKYVDRVGFDNIPKTEERILSRRVRTIQAKEELLAERVAVRVMQHLGLDTEENNAFSYKYMEKYGTDLLKNSDLPLKVHTDWVDEECEKAMTFMLSLQAAPEQTVQH